MTTFPTNQTQIPVELVSEIKNTQIEASKAQVYAVQFAPFMQAVNIATQVTSSLANIEDPTAEQTKQAREVRLQLVKNRKDAERKKDELKADLLVETSLIQSLFNVIKNTSQLQESALEQIEKAQEIKEAARRQVLAAERAEKLSQYNFDHKMYDLGNLSDEQFDALLEMVQTAYQAKKDKEAAEAAAAAEKAIRQSLLDQRYRQIAPFARFGYADKLDLNTTQEEFDQLMEASIQAEKEDRQKQEQVRIENERLQAEAKAKAEAAAAAQAKLNLANDRSRKLASVNYFYQGQDLADISDTKFNKIYKEAAEAKSKAEAEAKAKAEAEAAEKARIEAEAKAKAEAEAKAQAEAIAAAKAPEKERLTKWVNEISLPSLDIANLSPEARAFVNQVTEAVERLKSNAVTKISQL